MGFCDDYSDDEMDVEELERRIWRDKMKLKRLKEMNKSKEGDGSQQGQSQEQARRIYTCGFVQCPHRKLGLGFEDRFARDNHQLTCPHRNSDRFGVSDFHMNEVEPVVFTQPFVQPKAATVTVATGTSTAAIVIVAAPPVNPSPPSLNLSGLDIPEDGKRMINDLVSSVYDTNIQGNKSI